MNNYIQVKSITEGVYYKIKVLGSDWHDVTKQNKLAQRTLGNTLSITFGPSYMVYKGTAKIYGTDGAGYLTVAKLRAWAGIQASGGTWVPIYDANSLLFDLIDHDGVGPIRVALMSDLDPTYLEPTKSFIYFPIEFWQVQ